MAKKLIYALMVLGLATFKGAYALHDPTLPTDPARFFGYGESGTDTEWSLQSILSAPERRIAVINGTRVREGDRLGSARIVRILESRVVLKTGGRTLTLHLLPESIKVKP